MILVTTQSKTDWLFITQSKVLYAGWLIPENNEKATERSIVWSVYYQPTCTYDQGLVMTVRRYDVRLTITELSLRE